MIEHHDPATCDCRVLLDSPAALRGRHEALRRVASELPSDEGPKAEPAR